MGLDMFLIKASKGRHPKWSWETEIAEWRKANQIHSWFVQHVQGGVDDCDLYPVSKEDLEKLLVTVTTVLGNIEEVDGKIQNGAQMTENGWEPILQDGIKIKDPSVAHALLPTQEGFFFGSTNYDEFYIETLSDTKEQLKEILANVDFDKEDVYYGSSW